MLFFHASGFHSDVAWLQVREEMATRQSLLGCCSHHEKARDLKSLQEKSLHCSCLVPEVWLGREGSSSLVLPPGRAGRLSLSSLGSLQKVKPLLDSATSATDGPSASQPLGWRLRKCASALRCITNAARSHAGKLEEPTKFHTKMKVKEFFLILSYTSLNTD